MTGTAHDPAPRQTPAAVALQNIADRQHTTAEVARRQSQAWWLAAPDVFARCLALLVAPLKILNLVVETAVSILVIAVIATGVFIYTGDIPLDTVVATVKPIGKKVIEMVQSSAQQSQVNP